MSKNFNCDEKKNGVKRVFGRKYNLKDRGKIERYHKTLYQELIARIPLVNHFNVNSGTSTSKKTTGERR